MFPAKVVRVFPYLKFVVSLVTVVLMSITIPLGSPVWVPIVIAALNAIAVFLTPNVYGEYTEETPQGENTE